MKYYEGALFGRIDHNCIEVTVEPFSIVCKSCAAKLKVTKLSAVGQVLACPKCGSMVRVTPPQGWVAPKPKRRDSQSHSHSRISADDIDPMADDPLANLGGNFEDLDDILTSKPAQVPAPQRRRKSAASQTADPNKRPSGQRPTAPAPRSVATTPPITSEISRPKVRQRQTNPVPGDEAPVLPNEDWTSDSTRKRRRLVTTLVAVLGSFLLLAAIAVAVIMNFPKSDPVPLADADPPVVEEDPAPDINPNFIIKKDEEKGLLDQRDLAANEPTVDEKKPFNVGGPPPVGQAFRDNPPPIVGNGRPNNRVIPNASIVNEPKRNHFKLQELTVPDAAGPEMIDPDPLDIDPPNRMAPDAPPKLLPQTPFAQNQSQENQEPVDGAAFDVRPTAKPKPTEIGLVESFDSDLGELSSLLQASGTSIVELQDLAASIRTQQVVGLPKYIVSTPDPNKLDVAEQLELPLGGLKFDAAPLSQVTKNLSAISGVPITIDARSIVSAGKDPNPKVTTTIKDTTLSGALTSLVLSLNLSVSVDAQGAVIGSLPDNDPTPFKFDIPNGITTDDTKANLVTTIKVMVEPETWVRKTDPATLELVGDQLTGVCLPTAQVQIEELLRKLSASFALSESPGDLESLATTTTRWKSAESNLAEAPQLRHSVQREVNDFLDQIIKRTGVTILINWQQVSQEGWTPQTIIPGNVREPSVEQTIAKIARSMNLTYRTVDAKTVVMTTFTDAAQTVDLEVYPISELVPNKLSAEMLRQLVTEALGAQLQSEKVRYVVQPESHCLVVSAPQQLQRQIEGLIDRLKSELKADRNPQPNQQASSPLSLK